MTLIFLREREDILIGEECSDPPFAILERNYHVRIIIGRIPLAFSPFFGLDLDRILLPLRIHIQLSGVE